MNVPTASAVLVTLSEGDFAGTYLLLPSGNNFVYTQSDGTTLTFSAATGRWVLTYADPLAGSDVWTATKNTVNPPIGDDSLVYTNSANDTHDVLSSVQSYGNVRTDNFNRANSSTTLGSPSDGGAAWIVESGTWGITSNQGILFSGAQATAVLQAGVANVLVLTTLTGAGDIGLCCRTTDANNQLILGVSGSMTLYTKIAGSFTVVTSMATSVSAGDVIGVLLSGSAVNIIHNGVVGVGASTSFNQTATLHGIRSNNETVTGFDNFSIQQAIADVAIAPSGNGLNLSLSLSL